MVAILKEMDEHRLKSHTVGVSDKLWEKTNRSKGQEWFSIISRRLARDDRHLYIQRDGKDGI